MASTFLMVCATACASSSEPSAASASSPTTSPIVESSTTTTVGQAADTSPGPSVENDPALIVLPDLAGTMAAEVQIGCPGGPVFPASALNEIRPYEQAGFDQIESAIREFLDDEEGQFWPQDDWQILYQTDRLVELMHHDDSAEQVAFSFLSVEIVAGDWKMTGASSGGQCPLRTQIAEGLNTVVWRLDPASDPLTPESSQLKLLVTERECVSGQEIGDRLIGPEIVTTDAVVYITFVAHPPPGETQTCPGNPEQPVTVQLSEPLGNRVIAEGLTIAGNLEDFLP